VQFCSTGAPGAPIERIGLTGGGAALPGLAESLAEQHSIAAGIVTPMQHIRNRFSSKEVDHDSGELNATAVSVGLAMGAAA
jgi:Tfp pilus assembly PilM family ATPase